MFVRWLEYSDKASGWTLDRIDFKQFNLLVGGSGSGKTKTLEALLRINLVAIDRRRYRRWRGPLLANVAWTLGFEHKGNEYTWKLETSTASGPDIGTSESELVVVDREMLTSSADGELVVREGNTLQFRGASLPLLSRSESALNLLKGEPLIAAARAGFVRNFTGRLALHPYPYSADENLLERLKTRYRTIDDLRQDPLAPVVVKAYVLQEYFPAEFESIKAEYAALFPLVENLRVVTRADLDELDDDAEHAGGQELTVQAFERGVSNPIDLEDLSGGMLRSLNHVINLSLAPRGTVALIDEFENSLGVNCLGAMTDFLLLRARDVQFIITSHHPYIINNVPPENWIVIRRTGSHVRGVPVRDIPALSGLSRQDAFTRLINSPDFTGDPP